MHLQNAQLCICSSTDTLTHTATLGDSGGEVVFSISEKQVSTAASFALLPRFFFPLLTTEPHFVCMLGSCNSYIFVMELVLLPCTCSAQRRMHVCAHAHTCIWYQLNKRERGCVKEDRHRAVQASKKVEEKNRNKQDNNTKEDDDDDEEPRHSDGLHRSFVISRYVWQ